MADIAMCKGGGCPFKESCYRFTAKMGYVQSMFASPPFEVDEGGLFSCEYLCPTQRSLSEIAREIRKDWKNIHYAALPYLNGMQSMSGVDAQFGKESAKSIVLYFLSNAGTWRGEVAKRIKKELKDLIKDK